MGPAVVLLFRCRRPLVFKVKTVKVPATIQLAGKPVTVRKSKRPLKNDYGYYRNGEIVISCDLPDDKVLLILTHEAFHGLFYYLDEAVVDHASKELIEAYEILELI